MTQQERAAQLIAMLMREMPQYNNLQMPVSAAGRWRLLRSLMNVRPPMPASPELIEIQDAFLRQMTAEKGIVEGDALPPSAMDERIVLWQGDITRLACDAIVNAANSQLLGCFSPCHGCIDNIIHTMAGVQLRLACAEVMRAQGHEEPTGRAKITPGFNLPAKHVLHTVGPIITGEVTPEDEALLASCYTACLDLAAKNDCRSVAFCCISTGVFAFPQQRAAEIAVDTVRAQLEKGSPIRRVIFNVFKDEDRAIYERLLTA